MSETTLETNAYHLMQQSLKEPPSTIPQVMTEPDCTRWGHSEPTSVPKLSLGVIDIMVNWMPQRPTVNAPAAEASASLRTKRRVHDQPRRGHENHLPIP